jgi:alpha-ketoglutarate-dependent taurine dioxygenase
MHTYNGVTTRFLNDNERLILSKEKEMPLVIEAADQNNYEFLCEFLSANAPALIEDMAHYGAVLLRGFAVDSAEQFEQTVLSIPQFSGISEAFMAENGRVPVGGLKYVLHTNSVYKTGGTLYLGGFHTENYYSLDVPGYICFYCQKPSSLGGETGIINTEKIYRHLSEDLKKKLEKNTFFVSKWLVSEVESRYKIDANTIEQICHYFNVPLIGEGNNRFILMYKPSVFEHPLTKEKALQLNLFELPALNDALRTCFVNDYAGSAWFWHRFFWSLPAPVFNSIESLAVFLIAFFHSPKNSYKIVRDKYAASLANKKVHAFDTTKVGSCFSENEVKELAQNMRDYYSSCLWKKGDVLLIDNKKVMHAGMPGQGDRVIRAMICNPVAMNYSPNEPGCIHAQERVLAIGECMASGTIP